MSNLISLILLAYVIQVVESLMELKPRTITVLRGDSARLTCSTTEQWEVMVWLLNGSAVLTISFQFGMLSNNPNMTAVNCSTNQLSSWEFFLISAQRSHQGQVTCDLQNIHRETANLFIQERGNVAITGGNQTAMRGEEVLFQCLAVGWYPAPSLTWLVNGREVDQGQYSISTEQPFDVDGFYNLHSNLSIQAAVSCHVECLATVSALPTPQASSVRLTVVAEVENVCNNSIALIAGTASLSAILLLMLLSVCIALCYKQRRKAKSSKHMTRRIDESERERSSVAEATQGKVNLGYTTEGYSGPEWGDLIVTSGAHCQTGSISAHKIPDVVSSSNSNSPTEHNGHGFKNIRRVTTV
ncbi:immunoglobulin superfamily member 5 isoform X1 [Esox lucius]|uniref:immunoglobulin superfamily member 5 isoform X1 n=2 Tax=Esox lucius TaxID=8010 RepID=UPI000576EDF9|nr:immunoglobulin superfamily member 5 isoform X1 [Esox lucius]XP_019903132.1 immunoglobulin superfamily member 5 isoform X1 [Esox lucius]